MTVFRVVETQVFDVEAEDAEDAEATVRDGVSHTDALTKATLQFFVSDRTVEEVKKP